MKYLITLQFVRGWGGLTERDTTALLRGSAAAAVVVVVFDRCIRPIATAASSPKAREAEGEAEVDGKEEEAGDEEPKLLASADAVLVTGPTMGSGVGAG